MLSILFIIVFIISILLYKVNLLLLASIFMLAFSIYAYIYDIKKSNNIVNLRALYSLGFVGSFGLTYLKLSNLSLDYNYKFFIVILLAIAGFYISYEMTMKYSIKNQNNNPVLDYARDGVANNVNTITNRNLASITNFVYRVMLLTMAISFVAFIIEASILKFVPLFVKDVPHAYSTFHIFMLHYVTTFYIFVPCISVMYLYYELKSKHVTSIIKARVIISILYAVVMSTLLVSRGQLLMSMLMCLFMFAILFLNNYKISKSSLYEFIKRHLKAICFIIVGMVALYLMISIRRSHSVSYLNDIFDMKNKNMPIYITQPYMYLTEGFENLNYMIEKLTNFTFGKRTFKPLFTLTFMDKLFYFDFIYEQFILKTELTNMTIFYDAYFDFAYAGVLTLAVILGYVSARLQIYIKTEDNKYNIDMYNNPIGLLFYVLVAYYLIMSFFQPFFSLASSTVYILYIVVLYMLF